MYLQLFYYTSTQRLNFICYEVMCNIFFLFIYYRCEECGSMFAIKSRLITHQNTVHNEPVHPCQVCDKSFKTLTLLKRHTVIHSRFKPYCCPFCNHSSNSQSNLTKHVRKIHSLDDFSYHKSVFLARTITKMLDTCINYYFVFRFINGK